MPNLSRRPATAQALELDAALSQHLHHAQMPGLVAAARIQSAALAAGVGVHEAARLSRAVNWAFEQSPAGEPVYQAIFMAYGAVAASEVQRLGLHTGGR